MKQATPHKAFLHLIRAKYHQITAAGCGKHFSNIPFSEFPGAKRRLKKAHEQPGIKTNSTQLPLNFPQSPVQIHVPSTACDVVTFLTVKDNCVC